MRKIFLATTLVLAGIAGADTFDNQVASIVLLQDKMVQTELKITAAQRAKLNAFGGQFNAEQKAYFAEMEKKMKANNGKAPDPDKKREFKMVTDLKAKVLGSLSATQVKRLREISLQAIGVTALGDNTVASRVGLNATQKKKIQDLLTKGLKDVEAIQVAADKQAKIGIPNPKNQKEYEVAQKKYAEKMKTIGPPAEKKIEAIRQRTIRDATAVMTPGQTAVWRGLLGPMFKPKA